MAQAEAHPPHVAEGEERLLLLLDELIVLLRQRRDEERVRALRRPSGEDLPTTEAELRERIRHEDH